MENLQGLQTTSRKKIFLIDGIGATVTMLGLIAIYFFEEVFGMPKDIVRLLIGMALLLAVYSLSCYYLRPANWRLYLRIAALLNIGYCSFTIVQMVENATLLTRLGYGYFIGETLIVLLLSVYEVHQTRKVPV